MRIILIFIFISLFGYSFTQDTIRYGVDIIIYKNGKIIQKEFSSSESYIKIIYQYNEYGILIRRFFYNNNNELLNIILDN